MVERIERTQRYNQIKEKSKKKRDKKKKKRKKNYTKLKKGMKICLPPRNHASSLYFILSSLARPMDTIARHHHLGFPLDHVAYANNAYNQLFSSIVPFSTTTSTPRRLFITPPESSIQSPSMTSPPDSHSFYNSPTEASSPTFPASLDPPARIVPSQKREDTFAQTWIGVPSSYPPGSSNGGWTTASLIGIGALPATSLRNLQNDGE